MTAARRWLDSHATRPLSASGPTGRSVSDSFRIFADPSPEEAQAEVDATRAWQRQKWDAGIRRHLLAGEFGGRGLTRAHERAFHRLERETTSPGVPRPSTSPSGWWRRPFSRSARRSSSSGSSPHSCAPISVLPAVLRTRRRVRSSVGHDLSDAPGGGWRINGQKVWCSGVPFCEWGEAVVRTSREGDRDAGLTVFLVPTPAVGVETRPIMQMTGVLPFDEVFLTDVFVDDDLRLGAAGAGLKAASATLGFERGEGQSSEGAPIGMSSPSPAGWGSPATRSSVRSWHRCTSATGSKPFSPAGPPPGTDVCPAQRAASVSKLMFTNHLCRVGDVAGRLLGPGRLTGGTRVRRGPSLGLSTFSVLRDRASWVGATRYSAM